MSGSRPTHAVLGENTSTNTHVFLSVLFIVLATPSLNPVLLFCEALSIPPVFFSTFALVFLLQTLVSDAHNIVYYGLRIFFHSILSIFFRSIEVVGAENIPSKGPVIYTGNHMNQFVDGLMVLCHGRHRVGFMIAQKSYDKPVLGFFAKLVGCIPVQRPQDSAKKGTGTITLDGSPTVIGSGTKFTKELAPGDKLRCRGDAEQLKVVKVASDTELELDDKGEIPSKTTPFDTLARVDQKVMYAKVYESFKDLGRCLGIFPEGGSHDNTDLLPLKPGVAFIAMGALDEINMNVPIVPVGINYFDGHNFRGRCVIEFGPPIRVSGELYKEYREDKRSAVGKLLEQIEDGIKSCLTIAPTYDELELIYMTRRIFSRDDRLTTVQKQDLNRRFAFWYNNFYVKRKEEGNVPADLESMNQKIRDYRDQLKLLGLRDYQVRHIQTPPFGKVLGTVGHMIIVILIAAVPSLFLNFPVGMYARIAAETHRKQALAKSNVKINADDVRLSNMIQTCLVGVPALWISYAFILLILGVPFRHAMLFLVLCPVFSYLGVVAVESGMVDLKDLKPILLRLMVNHGEMKKLVVKRKELNTQVRALVKKYGPEIGNVYTDQNVAWSKTLNVGFPSMLNLSEASSPTASPRRSPASSTDQDPQSQGELS